VKIKTASKYLSILTVVSSLLVTVSCKKKAADDTEVQSVVDNAMCEQEFMQIQPTANSRAINTKGTGTTFKTVGTASFSVCDTLHKISGDTLWGTTSHKDPVYEFDFTNCSTLNGDNSNRSGKYIIRLTGPVKTIGSKMIIKLQNYKVTKPGGVAINYSCDSMIVETTASSFVSSTPGSLPASFSFKIDIINGICSSTTGWTIHYNTSKTITTTTNGTAQPGDDITVVNGTANGVNREGRAFNVTMYGIEKKGDCPHITKGTVDVKPDGFNTRTVDYGDGTCDDNATYTVSGQKIAFKLN